VSFSNDPLFHRIKRSTGRAIGDFNLIEEGDRIAVGISGGKDSYTLLHVLEALRRKAPIRYELIPVTIDAGFPGFRSDVITTHLQEHGLELQVEMTDCRGIIEQKLRPGTSFCAFCARLRRGALYSLADRLNCNKLALGHHLDDFIETLLLNQFYIGRLAAMSPKLLADNGRHTVIRPMVYVEESDIASFSQRHQLPVVGCSCPMAGQGDLKRQRMKELVKELAAENPHLRRSILHAMGRVEPRHLLDRTLKQF
jgi:tRNA 2-thiocytidine biosynthesis protein TtcA